MNQKMNLSILITLLLGLLPFPHSEGIYQDSLSIENLKSIFDGEDCIEGSLIVMDTDGPVLKTVDAASNVQPEHIPTTKLSDKNETEINEKSPISLVYELAQFNQIEVMFILTDEKGPAHKKQFVISLHLGKEEYVGEGNSIKKAQNEASKLALNSTMYIHPPKKSRDTIVVTKNKTPVQKLDMWAKKHNNAIVQYVFNKQTKFGKEHTYDMYSKAADIHKVTVKIGNQFYIGEDSSQEIAQQKAATNALNSLQSLDGFCMLSDKENNFFTKMFDSNSNDDSPISLIHEFGSLSNMPVSFSLYSEEGPAHIKRFVYQCTVGNSFETFGEGSSKKGSKRDAAEKMLEKLKRHLSLSNINCAVALKKVKPKKKKSKNLIKSVSKTYPEEEEMANPKLFIPEDLDPISKLYQIQQTKHEVLPVFTLLESSNDKFVIEVRVNDLTAIGSGGNKKTAKKNAAKALLENMGYSTRPKEENHILQQKKTDFSKTKETFTKKQIAPGLYLKSNKPKDIDNSKDDRGRSKYASKTENNFETKGKDGANNVPKSQNDFENQNAKPQAKKKSNINPKSQLLQFSQNFGFKFQFSDFSKGNNNGFVSVVSLTTNPPRLCYGEDVTLPLAQDKAALSALGSLYKSELDYISKILQEENTDAPAKISFTMVEEEAVVAAADDKLIS